MTTAIPQGHECADRDDFTELLRWWFETTDDPTVGDVGSFGGKAWVHVTISGVACHLNADTGRPGVHRYLDLVREHVDGLPWFVIANARGNVNRVALGPDKEKVTKFYLYTDDNQSAPREL
jgi:hypothetical protein